MVFLSFTHEKQHFMQFCLLDSPQKCYNCINRTSIFFQHPKEVFVCSLLVSLRCVFWVAPLHTGGGIDSPRPASQRAAAFILTAAMLTTLAAPAFAGTWYIEDGDITVKAGETKGTNKVSQGANQEVEDTDTIITNREAKASSNTVTIETNDKNDKVEVTLKDVNIDTSSRKKAAVSVTGEGDTNIKLNGDNALKSDIYRSGIYGSGSLTISGGENDSLTAQGGAGGSGIHISRNGSLTISGGTVTANGDDGGSGIYSSNSSSVTISGGMVTANGGSGNISGGDGICSDSGDVTISGGTVTATGGGSTGSNGLGGRGICSDSGGVTISGGTVKATGGNGDYSGGDGISSSDRVAISGGTVTANGGDSSSRKGASGISSSSGVTVSGGTVNANGGNGDYNGGSGISSFDRVAVSGGTVTANGGSGNISGGDGIYSDSGDVTISGGSTVTANGESGTISGGDSIHSNDIDLSGSLELTAKAGSPNGKALSQNGRELDLDTIKDKLGPGAKVTATDANGETKQVSSPIPRPVEPEEPEPVIPEESSSSSDGGSATPSAPASPLPGLTVTDKSGAVIDSISTQSGNTLTVCIGRLTASFRISLAALRQLRAEGIETITFQTILCSTTLSLDELLAMGGEDAEVVLTHHIRSSTLTVGGKAV